MVSRRLNLVLIGMPGSGKSVIGKILAEKLKRKFIDVDRVIEKREGLLLGDVLKKYGAKDFLHVEEEACLSIKAQGAIVAPGGSVILEPRAVRHFKKTGTLIYLRVGLKELRRRLGDLRKRGVVPAKGGLKGIYDLRRPLYERHADHSAGNRNAYKAVKKLKKYAAEFWKTLPRRGEGREREGYDGS